MLVVAKDTCFYGGKLRFKGESFHIDGDEPSACMIKAEVEAEAEVEVEPKANKKA